MYTLFFLLSVLPFYCFVCPFAVVANKDSYSKQSAAVSHQSNIDLLQIIPTSHVCNKLSHHKVLMEVFVQERSC